MTHKTIMEHAAQWGDVSKYHADNGAERTRVTFEAERLGHCVDAIMAEQAKQRAFAWFVSGPKLHRTVYNRAGIEPAVQEMIKEDPNSDSDDYTATELVLNVGQARCFESLPK